MINETNLERHNFSWDYGLQLLLTLIRFWKPRDGWLALTLLTLNLMVVAWSIERADWTPTPNLAGLMFLSILTSLILSRIPFSSLLMIPIGFLVGALIILTKLRAFQDGQLELVSTTELFQRLGLWFTAAQTGGINLDPAPFSFTLMVLVWISGLVASWAFCRRGNFWGVFMIGTAGLLSNLTFLPATASIHLGIYLLTAILLVARIQSVRRMQIWDKQNIQYDQHLWILSISDSILIAIGVLVLAFILPIGKQWGPTNSAYELLRTPLLAWEDDFNRLFAGLPARRPLPYRIWGDVMAFQGTINPTDNPVLLVHSSTPMYLKARTYRTYTPKGWASLDTVLKPLNWRPTYSAPRPLSKQLEVNYSVTHYYDTRSLFVSGQAMEIDRSVSIETYDAPIYELALNRNIPTTELSPKINEISKHIQDLSANKLSALTPADIQKALPQNFRLVSSDTSNMETPEIKIAQIISSQPDILSIRSTKPKIKEGDIVEITSSLSTADPDDLKLMSKPSPNWVLDKYTQLPITFPIRIRALTQEITLGYKTQYDKVKAIEKYLKKNLTYNLRIQAPPYNVDGVEHFLFTTQEGYSEYFASAMTVMLRSEGIPARLATGYSTGNKLPEDDIYLVRDKHSHAWVEVFFSEHGWIQFEPTPGYEIPLTTKPPDEPKLDSSEGAYSSAYNLDCMNEEDCEDDDDVALDDDSNFSGNLSIWNRFVYPYLPWYLGISSLFTIITICLWVFWAKVMASSSDPISIFQKLRFFSNLGSKEKITHLTPYELQGIMKPLLPNHQPELEMICENYVQSLYGNKNHWEDTHEAVSASWKRIRVRLLIHALVKRSP